MEFYTRSDILVFFSPSSQPAQLGNEVRGVSPNGKIFKTVCVQKECKLNLVNSHLSNPLGLDVFIAVRCVDRKADEKYVLDYGENHANKVVPHTNSITLNFCSLVLLLFTAPG